MSLLSFFGKNAGTASRKHPRSGRSEAEVQLELTLLKQREARLRAAKLQQEIDAVPGKIKKLEADERRKIEDRAKKSPTIHGLGRPAQKLQVTDTAGKMTRAEQRMMRNRLILLCITFAGILVLLWKSVR